MMPILISFPVLGVLTMVQSAIMSRVHLLHGTTDLVLLVLAAWALHERTQMAWHWAVIGGLMIGLASALPLGITLAGYLLITALALFLKRQAWKAPVLALFLVVFLGTALTHLLSIVYLLLSGATLNLFDALNLVTLPSLILNLLLALPVYVFVSDLANWLYPKEIEV